MLIKAGEVGVSFISMLANDNIPSVTIKAFPNQKLWVDRMNCIVINAHSAAFNTELATGNTSTYKPYKRRYQPHVESQFTLNAGAPKGCVHGPLDNLYTHDCVAKHSSNSIVNLLTILWCWASSPTRMRQVEVENLALWS